MKQIVKMSLASATIRAVFCLVFVVCAGSVRANPASKLDVKDIVYLKSLEEHVIMLHLGAITSFAPGSQMDGAEVTLDQRNRICYEMFELWLIFFGPQASGDPKKPYVGKLLKGMRVWYREISKSADIYADPLRVLGIMHQGGAQAFAENAGRLVGVDSSQVRTLEDYQKMVAGFHAWIEAPLGDE